MTEDLQITPEILSEVDPWYWAYGNKIKLQVGVFGLTGHEYLIEPMQSTARRSVFKKSTQMGATEKGVLRTLHGMIYGRYPKGVLYLFPTGDDVSDFSRSRFKGLMNNNPLTIGQFVGSTESTEIKQIGKSWLYLRGARSTSKVEGEKKESSKLRSIPVDKIVFDEIDLMDPDMVFLALQRLADSEIKEEEYISSPTIPDFGIDKLYQESDQRVWVIRCPRCRRDCCLELDFPESVKFRKDGSAYRSCSKCGEELQPKDGRWIAQKPGVDTMGWWISRLNSLKEDPGVILRQFENPPNGNLAEVYNSILGMAYIAAENRLTVNDVYSCCGTHILQVKDNGPCGMGIDVQGKTLVCVIGKKVAGGKKKIVWIGEVPDFSDAIELAKRFGVRTVAIDAYPETRKAREFQKSSGVPTYLCVYRDKIKGGEKMDEETGMVDLARTEICDMTHMNVVKGVYLFPRRGPQVEEFARQMINIAKVLEEDEKRGTKLYRYRKLGPDHFRHALNYFEVAVKGLSEAVEDPLRHLMTQLSKTRETYNPLTYREVGRA